LCFPSLFYDQLSHLHATPHGIFELKPNKEWGFSLSA